MKNLSVENIKAVLVDTFKKDYKELQGLNELYNLTVNPAYEGSFYLDTLIELKHSLAHDVASMLDVDPDNEDYDEIVDFIDLTIGDLLEA